MVNGNTGCNSWQPRLFPDVLVGEARRDLEKLFAAMSIDPVWLSPPETKLGAVETWSDAQKCGELLRHNREGLYGILVSLPNFGDENGVADSLRLAHLRVPILVQACPDDLDQFGLDRRRDAFLRKDISLQSPPPVWPHVFSDSWEN
jgi:L-fucose isomerase-like protein